jgi:hypothetical protein
LRLVEQIPWQRFQLVLLILLGLEELPLQAQQMGLVVLDNAMSNAMFLATVQPQLKLLPALPRHHIPLQLTLYSILLTGTLQSMTTVTSLLMKPLRTQPKALIPTRPTKMASLTSTSMTPVEPISFSTMQMETSV